MSSLSTISGFGYSPFRWDPMKLFIPLPQETLDRAVDIPTGLKIYCSALSTRIFCVLCTNPTLLAKRIRCLDIIDITT
ncbi:hypothetical protein Hypma_004280 [Hypsizygus marmoreus]|uniref:Uncharacterized protein n=1 Tax=Hypsizygus marmoreus TaxID=39966 RepID=A0A369J7U9_HYPMA|nr:hypothetical protein Hypma_004280 [Hypsizygus marmoreus]